MAHSLNSTRETSLDPARAFLDSNQAVERLGISKSTLYAYVSRGLIRSEPVPDSPRQRRYRAEDVERLLQRQRMRADPEQSRPSTLDLGPPLPETSISSIVDGTLSYRGLDVRELATSYDFEAVIALLWRGEIGADLPPIDDGGIRARHQILKSLIAVTRPSDPIRAMQSALPLLEQLDPAAFDLRPAAIQRVGRELLQLFVAAIVGSEGQSGIARTLQAHLAPGRDEARRLLNATLILCADHDLNVSTFAVRCAASAGSPLHSVIAAGLAALRGRKHGGATLQAEGLYRECGEPTQAMRTLQGRLERGERLPGFGHRLYPDGDPRASVLLEMLEELVPGSESVRLAKALIDAAIALEGVAPNLDFALVTLGRELGLPDGSALVLKGLGRVSGWVAHAIEAYEQDALITPRARLNH